MKKRIIRYVIGGLFFLVSIRSLIPFEPSALIISLCIVIICFCPELRSLFVKKAQSKAISGRTVYKTYTLEPTGSLHACSVPNGKRNRQETITESRIGDPITVKKYEWNGEDAVIFINNRTGWDVGVARKGKDLSSLLVYLKGYDVYGKIVNIHDFNYSGKTYKGCNIEVSCYEK